MNSNYYGLIELLISFGLLFAFGFWQLASLRRLKQCRADAAAAKSGKPPPQ